MIDQEKWLGISCLGSWQIVSGAGEQLTGQSPNEVDLLEFPDLEDSDDYSDGYDDQAQAARVRSS